MQDLKENKIAILSTFYMFDSAYSLCNVVEDQIRMFVDHGYKIKMLVDEAFQNPGGYWKHPNLTYAFCLPMQRSNEGDLNDKWQEETNRFYECIKKELEGYKVVIGHDITLQPAHLIHNVATRRLAEERPDIRWLHWCHSATAPQVRCNKQEVTDIINKKFPNAWYCYPNDWDKKRVAINYHCELDEVKTVHHPTDFLSLMFGDELRFEEIPNLSEEAKKYLDEKVNYPIRISKEFCKEFDILNADVISVYPCRLDRGKQVEYNIKTMGAMKKLGRTVRMIVCDFHSTGGDKVIYREDLKRIAREWGLTEKECVFMSEWRPDTNLHVPREVIQNLKKIADFHMHPSTSETYSLVVQESIMWRNFCVLNHHTPYMRDIYGSKNVLYEPFSSAVNSLMAEDGSTTLNIHDQAKHFENLANKILYFIENNPVINEWRFIRQKRNHNYIFQMELEPLLAYEPLK